MARQNQNQNQNQNRNQNNNNNNAVPNAPEPEEFSLKETRPSLGGGRVPGNERFGTAFDLVEQMHYLYIRIVKGRSLAPKQGNNSNESPDPYVEIKLGNFTVCTNHVEKNPNPEWNQVFAFAKDRVQSLTVEVTVRDKEGGEEDNSIGGVVFDVVEVPVRVPPDSALAAQWYRLENGSGGELMVAVWMGTQADEAFPDAWHLDSVSVSGDGVANIRSKVYLSPRLWYVRVHVIEAHELNSNSNRQSEVLVKGMVMNMILRTKALSKPMWNEDLMFVVAEPFEEQLVLTVEEKLGNKEEVVGKCLIPLNSVERRMDNRVVSSKWYSLEKHTRGENGEVNVVQLNSKIHIRVCLDGGYHVLDELTQYSSDLRATHRLLGSPSIGVLELGILNANGLTPAKTRNGHGAVDAYCVAKYGQKWIRTRTVIDSLNPKWNEQYTWEVFDPCTVITIVVFDNNHLQGVDNGGGAKDARIGKVRIRLSTLETDRVYTHSYPLIVLHPSGVKKMGEIQLAVRFTCVSLMNLMQMYTQPLLPNMHYIHPLTVFQQDSLRHQATHIMAVRLNRAEPPLRKEVVEYMLDVGSNMWSLRKSKANYCRLIEVLSSVVTFCKWFYHVCMWTSPVLTVLVHVLFLILVYNPQMILSFMLVYVIVIGILRYRSRARHPPHMDIKLSYADRLNGDELDEEFDGFPSTKHGDALKMRYDRLRSVGSRIQTLIGDVATQGERVQNLVTWRDPRATTMFLFFCFVLAIVLYVVPVRGVVVAVGLFVMRHPSLRNHLPSVPMNFFRRLPARTDGLL
ncbi:putative C2 domain, phosphoribosyltransferase, C2 domain superfamily [Helianthus annuus]|nr:putative C2 domain, phosphoribosyltransferase, C2 domain superfamily [Helianthus annuus]